MTNSHPTESVRALLSEIIDYAGLFPPANLSMPEAVLNYATYKNSNFNWMLGRFVVPVVRLDEFLASAREFFAHDKTGVWQISVLASEDIYETIRFIEEFNARNAPYAVCDALEIKVDSSSVIEKIAEVVPPKLATFVELPLSEGLGDLVTTLAIAKLRAKIRMGGTAADAFPKVEQITRFMRVCLAANVPFKATAGLHHPLRCFKPLTYENNAPEGVMNGFLNVFLAAGFLRQGFKPKLIGELLEDESAESFQFDESGVLWRQEYFIPTPHLRYLREKNIISFGSCSFKEPIEDLQEIGLL